jgi:hypothetical protein
MRHGGGVAQERSDDADTRLQLCAGRGDARDSTRFRPNTRERNSPGPAGEPSGETRRAARRNRSARGCERSAGSRVGCATGRLALRSADGTSGETVESEPPPTPHTPRCFRGPKYSISLFSMYIRNYMLYGIRLSLKSWARTPIGYMAIPL